MCVPTGGALPVGNHGGNVRYWRGQGVEGGRTEHGGNSLGHETTHTAYAELMLDLGKLDVDEIAMALSDQTDYEHRWLIDPRTGEIAFWTSDTGIDGENPIDLDELDLMPIDPLPSWVWYADMADFAEGVSDDAAGQRLERAIRGRGAFRRFKDELFEEHPDLVSAWHAFHDARANRRAVEWLLDQGLIRDDAARKFLVDHPDPDLP